MVGKCIFAAIMIVITIMFLSGVIVMAFTTEQEATTFVNEATNTNNVYHYRTIEVTQKLNSQEITVMWVVEIHAPPTQTNHLDEQGKLIVATVPGKEIHSIPGSTTVHTTESLTTQKTKIEKEAITQAKNWKPNPTIQYKTHELKYSKELR